MKIWELRTVSHCRWLDPCKGMWANTQPIWLTTMQPLKAPPSADLGAICELTQLPWKLVTSPNTSLKFGWNRQLVSRVVGEEGIDKQTGTCTQAVQLHKPHFLRKPEKNPTKNNVSIIMSDKNKTKVCFSCVPVTNGEGICGWSHHN